MSKSGTAFDEVQTTPSFRVLDLIDRRHVRHRTSGTEVGQDDTLMVFAKDIGRFGHEMNAAEDDIFGLGLRRHYRKLVAVARQIGVADNVVALVMMAENDDALAQFLAGRLDPLVHLRVGHREVIFENLCSFKNC